MQKCLKILIFATGGQTVIIKKYLKEKFFMQVLKPKSGQWFLVDIDTFKMSLFIEERQDKDQEVTRRRILQAIREVESNNFPRKFQTKVPIKKWKGVLSKAQLNTMLDKSNVLLASETAQFLEWGQRLSNGETWEELCNIPDNNNYLRLVYLEGAKSYTIIGGTKKHHYPKEDVFYFNFGYKMPLSTVYCPRTSVVLESCVPLLFKTV